jgi:hypothetical protein
VTGEAGLGNALRQPVRMLDRILRRVLHIGEFSGHPQCLLRFAHGRIQREVRLADGSTIRPGAAIVDLHLWNERLAFLPSPRRGLARASALRRDLGTSLRELARRLETDPAFAAVVAVRARAAFVPRKRLRQVVRFARAYGFDAALTPAATRHPTRLEVLSENLLLLALAWTFNPASLRRNGMRRERTELWISRAGLLARFGAGAGVGRAAASCRQAAPSPAPDFSLPAAARRARAGGALRPGAESGARHS